MTKGKEYNDYVTRKLRFLLAHPEIDKELREQSSTATRNTIRNLLREGRFSDIAVYVQEEEHALSAELENSRRLKREIAVREGRLKIASSGIASIPVLYSITKEVLKRWWGIDI